MYLLSLDDSITRSATRNEYNFFLAKRNSSLGSLTIKCYKNICEYALGNLPVQYVLGTNILAGSATSAGKETSVFKTEDFFSVSRNNLIRCSHGSLFRLKNTLASTESIE